MGIKPDHWIRKMAWMHNMIEPFEERQVAHIEQSNGGFYKVISYGLSSYGYDIRVADEFKVFTNVRNAIVDPKCFTEDSFIEMKKSICIIPPNSFALARSIEYFRIPRSVLTICLGKSTYARCGIIVNVTPFEPEWEGYVTIEISNTTPLPAKIYANEGIAQVIFFEADESCEVSYADKKGKYMKQYGVTLPRI
jgi:dCTP deaminase